MRGEQFVAGVFLFFMRFVLFIYDFIFVFQKGGYLLVDCFFRMNSDVLNYVGNFIIF